jgi:hypothetical protein
MSMTRLAAATLFLAAAGCASGPSGRRLEREGSATLTGVVTPPKGQGPKGNTSCSGVVVRVFHTREPTQPLGSLLVKQNRERCLYVVSNLPGDAELRLEVSPGTSWQCPEGEAPTLTPRPGVVKLRDYETATRDFRATCD